MYCVNGASRSSLLRESTDSMICDRICENVQNCKFNNNYVLVAVLSADINLSISRFFYGVMNCDLRLAVLEGMSPELICSSLTAV